MITQEIDELMAAVFSPKASPALPAKRVDNKTLSSHTLHPSATQSEINHALEAVMSSTHRTKPTVYRYF